MQLKITQYLLTQALDPAVPALQFEQACRMLVPSRTLSAQVQLHIYRQNVSAAHQHVLALIYPVCRQILGEDCFHALTRDYAWHIRYNRADLNDYGADFAKALQQQQSRPSWRTLAYLPDLARLEWAWHQSLFKADTPPAITPHVLQELINQVGDRLVPQLAPSVFLLATPWPVYDVWHAHHTDQPTQQFNLPEETQYLVIVRRETVMIDRVKRGEYEFLRLAQAGLSLSTIVARLGEQAAATLRKLPQMFNSGWLHSLRAPAKGR